MGAQWNCKYLILKENIKEDLLSLNLGDYFFYVISVVCVFICNDLLELEAV